MPSTPGPWHPRPTGRHPHVEVVAADGDDTPIATVHLRRTVSGDRANALANARLLAAAPNLLDALTCYVADDTCAVTGQPDTESSECRDASCRYHWARQLIANATGGPR